MFKICAKTVLKINWSKKSRDTSARKLLAPGYGFLLLYVPESHVIGYSICIRSLFAQKCKVSNGFLYSMHVQ